jgi:hypothetical protein
MDAFSLAKGLHNVNMALTYFKMVKADCEGQVKNTFNGYINKCQYIINDIKASLGDDIRKVFNEELRDSLEIFDINDKILHLNSDNRLLIDNLLDDIIKGKNVKIVVED